MNFRAALRVSAVALMPLFVFPVDTMATNGSFLIGYGAKSRGLGGAGVAFAQDALASAVNPAAISEVETRIDIGAMLFNPTREAWVPGFSGRDEVKSGANLFLIPNMGGVYKFNRKISFGFSAVGSGGGNTRYNENFFDFAGEPQPTLGVNLAQAVMSPTISYKLTKNHSVGFSPLIALQSFRAYGYAAFEDAGFSSAPGSVSNRGNELSYGYGVRFGWLGNFFDGRLSIGAAASSKIFMSRFSKYNGVFAENGHFDIPAVYTVGLAVRATDKLTVAADYQYIEYSGIAAIHNPGPTRFLPLPPEDELMGAKNGLGFGWNSMKVYKVGLNYEYNDKWTLRAGYNYGDTPIRRSQVLFNTQAPATVEHHATAGFTYSPNKNSEWTFALMRAFQNDIVAFDEFSGDNIRISMDQWAMDVSYGFHF